MSIEIILAHAEWCPHCKHFSPIYKNAQKIINGEKLNKTDDAIKEMTTFFKKHKTKVKSFDFANEDEKHKFNNEYSDLSDKIDGYPTVLLKYDIDGKNGTKIVETTVIDHKNINNKEQDELEFDASKEFVNNVMNLVKTFTSDNKDLFVQGGGGLFNKNMKEFKNKDYYDYVNYKIKYMQLQKNI